jgi:hypothetical protein
LDFHPRGDFSAGLGTHGRRPNGVNLRYSLPNQSDEVRNTSMRPDLSNSGLAEAGYRRGPVRSDPGLAEAGYRRLL